MANDKKDTAKTSTRTPQAFLRYGKLPDGIPPHNGTAIKLLRIAILGAHPEADAGRVSYTFNIGSDFPGPEWVRDNIEYLCEGTVYSLDVDAPSEPQIFSCALCVYQRFAFVIVYATHSLASFEDARRQTNKLLATVRDEGNGLPFQILLLGLTTCLPKMWYQQTEARQVSVAEGKAFAETCGCMFAECSANNEAEVIGVFATIVEDLHSTHYSDAAQRPEETEEEAKMAAARRALSWANSLEAIFATDQEESTRTRVEGS
ncbi:hypothetical protein CC80DRAFT_501789 [Byssothecium circinans]|uniref:small monomeric GTPase n=1 Tax=Byssothecium circinans TaxID=147558 RepID=A0A6A5U9P4_9PLEO|nr:hypothetical protein CC80DRAFT_501789 [Byssothecium circinans]